MLPTYFQILQVQSEISISFKLKILQSIKVKEISHKTVYIKSLPTISTKFLITKKLPNTQKSPNNVSKTGGSISTLASTARATLTLQRRESEES